jgi:hypothetical protein
MIMIAGCGFRSVFAAWSWFDDISQAMAGIEGSSHVYL